LQFYQQALGIDGGPWLAAFNNDQTRMRNFFDLMSQGQFQDAWNLLDKNSDLYKNSTLTQGKIVLNDFSDLSKYLKFMVMSHQIDFTTGLYKVDQNNNLLVNVGLRHDEGSVTFFGDETKFKMNSPNMSFIWFNVPADMVVSLGGTVNFMGEFSPVKQKTSSRASVYLDAAKRFTLAENLLDATAQLGGQYNINTPNPWNARMLLRSDLRLADPLSLYATTGWNLSGPSLKQTTFRYGAGAKYTPFVKQESAWKDLNISIGVEAGQYTEYKVGIGVPLNLLFGGGKLNYSATRQSR
jgi:hypothetical protein